MDRHWGTGSVVGGPEGANATAALSFPEHMFAVSLWSTETDALDLSDDQIS